MLATLLLACGLDLILRLGQLRPPAILGFLIVSALSAASGIAVHRAWRAWRMQKVFRERTIAASAVDVVLPCLAHEIRNYSSLLKGNARLLRARLGLEPFLEPLARIERTTEKIESLAQEILDAAFVRIGGMEPLCLHALLETCVNEHFHESRCIFRIEAEGMLPVIQGDSLKLERVFLNLFKNAREAGAEHIRVHLIHFSDRLRVLVEDNGEGCAPVAMSQLFQPLFTTKKARGGSGLGLVMVKAILDAHGATIRAISKNGWAGGQSGMIFCLDFPVGPARQLHLRMGEEFDFRRADVRAGLSR